MPPDPFDFPFHITDAVPIEAEDVTSLAPMADLRPELKFWQMNKDKTPEILDVFMRGIRQANPLFYKLLLCNIERDKGNTLYKDKKFEEAVRKYIRAARYIIGDNAPFPAKPEAMRLDRYEKISWQEQMDLVACCNNLAMCAIKMDNIYEVRAPEASGKGSELIREPGD